MRSTTTGTTGTEWWRYLDAETANALLDAAMTDEDHAYWQRAGEIEIENAKLRGDQ